MASFTIKEIRLHRIQAPLKQSFTTHLQSVEMRESILIEMVDESGKVGLGECVAFSSPWYTEETVQTCWDTLENWLIPPLIHMEIKNPEAVYEALGFVKGNRMAKAALDMASWDLFAKRSEKPLWRLLGGIRREIDAGIVLTGEINADLYKRVQAITEVGYRRVKLKIDETTDIEALSKLVAAYPSLYFFADGNGIFSRLGLQALYAFDHVGLTLIEQPFIEEDWALLEEASKVMKTPLALDESIRSVEDVSRMIAQKAGEIIVLKPGRVGGITESLRIHGEAVRMGIPIWIGGMIEFGISKAHNLALASLSQIQYPGDFSASDHFWQADIITPSIEVINGQIKLSEAAGIGYALNEETVKQYRIAKKTFW